MHILVTAGNTQAPIDRVRCLTNIFTGRTGAALALHAHAHGHAVTLLTSHPDAVTTLAGATPDSARWTCHVYRTFADLETLLADHIVSGRYDALFHSAAVSDYLAAGVYAPRDGTAFDPATQAWTARHGTPPGLIDRSAGKVRSDEPELWIRLVRAPKLIDRVRQPWGFRGVLVKFKLEVDVTEAELLVIAERSRQHSGADWMVANTLDGAARWAYLGGAAGYERIDRPELPRRLLDAVTAPRRGDADG